MIGQNVRRSGRRNEWITNARERARYMSDRQDEVLRILVWLLENLEHVHKADPFQIEINYLRESKRMLVAR